MHESNGNRPSKSPEEVRALLGKADWEELVPRFLLFAHRKLRKVRGRKCRGEPSLLGRSAEDLLNSAVEKLRSGERKWPEGVSLEQVIRGIIRSDASNLARKAKRERQEDAEDGRPRPNDVSQEADGFDGRVSEYTSAEQRKKILEYLADDPLAQGTAEYIIDHYNGDPSQVRPQSIARALGVRVQEIYKAKKRLRRKFNC